MFRCLLAGVMACGLLGSVHAGQKAKKAEKKVPEKNPWKQPHFEEHVKAFETGIAKLKDPVAYEGLPHQGSEKGLLAQELAKKKHISVKKFPFYQEPVSVPEDVGKKLAALLRQKSTFHEWGGPKLCGGFHPDWLLEFRDETNVYQVLVCFGCGELRLYGPDIEATSDLSKETEKELRDLLIPLRKNRPAPPAGGFGGGFP